MTSLIKPLGSFSNIDPDGYIINCSDIQKLPSKWRSALDEIIQEYIHNLGEQNIESVVVRGSVARGEPVDNISDIDTIAIVHNLDGLDKSWITPTTEKLSLKYPFITGFELVLWDSEKVNNPQSKNMRFMLKTQSVTVWGKDIIADIVKVKPELETARSLLRSFPASLTQAQERLEQEAENEKVKNECRWISKRIVRAGFYLVMPRARKFTKDLYPSYMTFSEYYPNKEADMKKTLEYCIEPTSNKQELRDFISDFGGWLNEEIQSVTR